MKILAKELANSQMTDRECIRIHTIDERHEKLNRDLVALEEKWDDRITKHKERSELRLREIQSRHKLEIEEFREKLKSTEFLKRFSHPSPDLLRIREREKNYAIAKQYRDALKEKSRGDKLQSNEEKHNQELFRRQVRIEYNHLRKAHAKELRGLEDFDKKVLDELEVKRQEVAVIQRSIGQMDVKRGTPLNSKMISLEAVIAYSFSRMDNKSKRDTALPTPRTMEQMRRYRSSALVSMNVKPLDDRKFKAVSRCKLPRLKSVR
jgi:hypothetical protein